LRHLVRVGDRGQVDGLVPLQHQIDVPAELLDLLRAEPDSHLRRTLFDLPELRSLHAHLSSRPNWPKSRTSRSVSPPLSPTISTRRNAVASPCATQASRSSCSPAKRISSSRTGPGPVVLATNRVPRTSLMRFLNRRGGRGCGWLARSPRRARRDRPR